MRYIPNEVHFYLQAEQELPHTDCKEQLKAAPVVCRPAFPVMGRSKTDSKTRENAKLWAAGLNRWSANKDLSGVKMVVSENVPRDGYRLYNAEQRMSGGRAWIVLTPDDYLVDMREDVFLPILLRDGIGPGPQAMIPGKFQWCVAGSQIRLEEVGSNQHAKYTLEEEGFIPGRRKRNRLPASALKVGGVYDQGGAKVYLGRVRHDGRLKWAFLPISHKYRPSLQDALQRALDNHPYWTVLSSGITNQHLGDVELPSDYKEQADKWKDGWGDRLIDVEW